MGRAFEYRKARKLKRWGHMARVFTKIGKEIEIAVKSAGPDPSANTRLRILIQNAKAENMPKENIERAIKRATEKDSADYKEVIYEGYGPHGIAVMVETATDNTNRTVANVRMHFSRCGGTLGNSGSVAFLFEHKCVFKFHVPAGTDFEELELSMIDLGVDEFAPEDETTVTVEAPYESFGAIQKWLDDAGQNAGAGKTDRIRQGVRSATFIGSIYSVLACIVLTLFGGVIPLLFVDASETVVIHQAHQFLTFNSLFYIPLTIVNVWRFTIQGMGYSLLAILAGVCEMIARALVGFALVPIFGYIIICFASPLAWLMADAFLIPAFYYCLRNLLKAQEMLE